jgi:hypothetical protein
LTTLQLIAKPTVVILLASMLATRSISDEFFQSLTSKKLLLHKRLLLNKNQQKGFSPLKKEKILRVQKEKENVRFLTMLLFFSSTFLLLGYCISN